MIDKEPTPEELSEQEGREHEHKCSECRLPFFCDLACSPEDYPEVCGLCSILEGI